MCNLNIIMKTEGERNIPIGLMCASAHSYATNSDGDGLYLDEGNLLVKGESKINIMQFAEQIERSTFIISHQRLATSGFSEENVHPFFKKRFVLAHNGILHIKTEFVREDLSDTHVFYNHFLKVFEENRGIRRAVEETLNKITSGGSYSVVIYDTQERKLYYFKNSQPNINCYRLEKGSVYLTTSSQNAIFFNAVREFELKDDILYEFYQENGKIRIKTHGKIKEPVKVYYFAKLTETKEQKTFEQLAQAEQEAKAEENKGEYESFLSKSTGKWSDPYFDCGY